MTLRDVLWLADGRAAVPLTIGTKSRGEGQRRASAGHAALETRNRSTWIRATSRGSVTR
jgi:hypothetical protein